MYQGLSIQGARKVLIDFSNTLSKTNTTVRERMLEEAIDIVITELDKYSWIPIKTRKLTEEEKEEYPDSDYMYDCRLPDDGQEVLVTTRSGYVVSDIFCCDEGCYFETYCDEGDVIAWRPLPEPYQKGGEEE